MYVDIFQELGLSKNEARIYETLLREGQSSVGHISTKSEVYRRNVYDSLNRLQEKGLVFEIITSKENHYQAVDPQKLVEMLDEKRAILDKVLPGLHHLFTTTPSEYSVLTYRGKEGWKNYLRDMLRIGGDAYFIAAKGGWLDDRIKDFFPYFIKEAKKRKLRFHHLFDYEAKTAVQELLPHIGENYKFLPEQYTSPSAVDIFGDRVNVITEIKDGELAEEIVFTVIINQQIADSFRAWFRLMWDLCPEPQ